MIRLPASVLTLGRSDLIEYDERRQERELENTKQQSARSEVDAVDRPSFRRFSKNQAPGFQSCNTSDTFKTVSSQLPLSSLPVRSTPFDHSLGSDGYAEEPISYAVFAGPDSSEDTSLHSRVASPENIVRETRRSSSPPKDGFRYGEFVDHPAQNSTDNTLRRSLPFDSSTPQNLLASSNQGYRTRTLPRSPLYFSRNASSSPERRPTTSLTPRVASRVINHNTPGVIFAQPARRPAHTFRHQANSFSFDSSERSSTAYEQGRISSLSTTDTTPRPAHELRLRDELRGSSLTSSRDSEVSERQSSFYERLRERDEEISSLVLDEEIQGSERTLLFPSLRLPLPPPFSSTSRSVTDTESLPSASPVLASSNGASNYEVVPAEFFESPSSSHNANGSLVRSAGVNDYHVTEAEPRPSPPRFPTDSSILNHSIGMDDHETERERRATVSSPMRLLRSGTARIVSYYRPRSPYHRSTSPNRSPREHFLPNHQPQTPSRSIAVYNDGLPAQTQPQTPAHLPESRHQSRYHPAYTAPVIRNAVSHGGFVGESLERVFGRTPEVLSRASTTPSRLARPDSPPGLQGAGFRGLFGGRENGDEEQSWIDGVRFSNAEVRLWGVRDAAADSRTLRDTPEREEWRVGRH